MRRRGCASWAAAWGVVLLAAAGGTSRAAGGFWGAVAAAPEEAAAAELRAAEQAAMRDRAGGGGDEGRRSRGEVERHLRRAIGWSPAGFEARRRFADFLLEQSEGRRAEALAALEAVRRLAPSPDEEARALGQLGQEEARSGRFGAALDRYERRLSLVNADSGTLAASAQVLASLGRADEAIVRCQDAISLEENAAEPRGRAATLAALHLTLATSLDRAGRARAGLDAARRAVALDPGLAVFTMAPPGSRGAYFISSAEADYALALARLAEGRHDEAVSALRSYVARPWHPHLDQARRRLALLERGDGLAGGTPAPRVDAGRAPARPTGLRVIREMTLSTKGPIAAPLIDAAFRMNATMLDGCLASASLPSGERQLRVSLLLIVGADGRVSRATVQPLPAGLDAEAVRCVETRLVERLQVVRPARRRPTEAKLELVLAPAEASAL